MTAVAVASVGVVIAAAAAAVVVVGVEVLKVVVAVTGAPATVHHRYAQEGANYPMTVPALALG